MQNTTNYSMILLMDKNILELCPVKNSTSQNLIWNISSIINAIIIPTLLFLGIVGNGLGLYFMASIRKRHRITTSNFYYHYLTYIAWINLVICLSYACRVGEDIKKFVTKTVYFRNPTWLYFHAHYTLVIINGFFGATILILCLILRDRFMNLHRPLRHIEVDNANISRRDTRNRRILKLLPLIFILISNLLSFSSYFWYDVVECIIVSIDKDVLLNHTGNVGSTSNGNKYAKNNDTTFYVKGVILPWSVTYDLIKVIILLVIPGFVILFYGFGITFLSITFTPIERISIQAKFIQNSKVASIKRAFQAKILARNLSALIYFALFCLCEVPNITFTILRYNIKSELVFNISDMMEIAFVTLIFYVFMLFDKNFHEEINKLGKRLRQTMVNVSLKLKNTLKNFFFSTFIIL
ncbi:unnamed protein product [Gordionus sp. m RMFG-2023]